MKKNIFFSSAVAVALSLSLMIVSGARAEETVAAGSLIKTSDSSTIYYLGEDGKLYTFPNDKTYFSWFEGFDDIQVVSAETFGSYPLGGNVYYKPGSLLVKTPTSLKVYAVGIGGELRWIESEELAKEFYGENWNLLVDDIPDGFFTNYFFGEPVDSSDDYDPEVEEEQAPTISHARKLKAKKAVKEMKKDRTEKRCEYLKNSFNRLQKRAERWGMEVPTLGDDYIEVCQANATQNEATEDEAVEDEDEDKKITLCKYPKGNPAAAHTIRVSKNSLKRHFREGYTIGACEGDDDEGNEEEEEDETAPAISAVAADPATSSAVISWTTDEDSDSKVEYDNEYPFSSAASVTDNNDLKSHSLKISGLTPDMTYHYVVTSIDSDGNLATSAPMSFKTDAIDTTGPVLSVIESVSDASSSVISWTTNEAADSRVVYSTDPLATATATSTKYASSLVTSHSLEITGLNDLSKYYYRVESTDASGNKTVSSEKELTTLAEETE